MIDDLIGLRHYSPPPSAICSTANRASAPPKMLRKLITRIQNSRPCFGAAARFVGEDIAGPVERIMDGAGPVAATTKRQAPSPAPVSSASQVDCNRRSATDAETDERRRVSSGL